MSRFTCLWIDDKNPLPQECGSEWSSARSAWEALLKLELLEFDAISLNADMSSIVGNKELTTLDILSWLVTRKMNGLHVPAKVSIHDHTTDNRYIRNTIKKYWGS